MAVSGPLLSHPTVPATDGEGEAGTRVLLAMRRGEERGLNRAGWGRAFGRGRVKEVVWEGGEGMPRGADEWREVMR